MYVWMYNHMNNNTYINSIHDVIGQHFAYHIYIIIVLVVHAVKSLDYPDSQKIISHITHRDKRTH